MVIHLLSQISALMHLISKIDEVFWRYKNVHRSPLRHLFKSNATPSDSELIAIRALISDAEARIEELHRRFPARNRVSQLIESQLLKIIEPHRTLLSPVRYLPSEILQEIFLCYADNLRSNYLGIATMPWRLGHISHRWRKIALSFPSLWDNIPKINVFSFAGPKPFYVQALICLIRRSCTSPTLKFDIGGASHLMKVPESPIIEEIILHSERIQQLRIEVNEAIAQFLQRLKGRLPNLRILRVYFAASEFPNSDQFDVFKTAPALRKVAIRGFNGFDEDSSVKVLLPWSQITHFEEQLPGKRVGQLVPLSLLRSLAYFDVDKRPFFDDFVYKSTRILSPYRPTTLSNLRVLFHDSDYKIVDLFLESLTIPAIEVMIIICRGPLIPRLVSMLSGSHGPSRLRRLAFRTIPLQSGELSALLNLTPHLIELEIDVPPADDLLRLIYGEGEVMLVPMLQALHMHSSVLTVGTRSEHLNTLARVRCELGSHKDSEDATMPSLGPRTCTTLDTLHVFFGSAKSRDSSQRILNNWSSSFTPEEAKVIDMIGCCSNYIRDHSFVLEINALHAMLRLDRFLARIESYKITNKVLNVGLFFWMLNTC